MPADDRRDEQRARAVELADAHVCVARHFRPLFPSRATAYREIARLHKERRLRVVGHVVMGAAGHPERVYCNRWKPKSDQLRHDILLTDFLLCYPEARVVRGWEVDPRLRPDATMSLDGQDFHIELDTGSESYRKVRERQTVYAGVKELVLYVTQSDRRLEGLLRQSEAIKEMALFTTLRQVLAEPHGDIWRDWFGNRTGI